MDLGRHERGAKHVTAIEGRPETLKIGQSYFEKHGLADRAQFVQGDMFDFLPKQTVGAFDTIFCLGVFYHIMDHYYLIRQMTRLKPSCIIIDSGFVRSFDCSVRVQMENPQLYSNALPLHTGQTEEPIGVVSLGLLIQMSINCGYSCVPIAWDRTEMSSDQELEAARDYLRGNRFTVRLTPQTSSQLSMADVQNLWREAIAKLNPKWVEKDNAANRPSYEDLLKKNRKLSKAIRDLRAAS